MLWIAEPGGIDDLASDMSVFHGIRDIGAMPAGTLARLAARIGAYKGAVSAPRAPAAAVRPPQPPPAARRRDPGPVASAAQLGALLAPVAGSGMYGVVRTVPRSEWDKPQSDDESADLG